MSETLEEERVLISSRGDEHTVSVSRVSPGHYRIEDFFQLMWVDDDVLDDAGFGSLLEIDELADGRLQLLGIAPDPAMYALSGACLPYGFAESQQFDRLCNKIGSLGGNWELVCGGLFSAYVPRLSADADGLTLADALDQALRDWQPAA